MHEALAILNRSDLYPAVQKVLSGHTPLTALPREGHHLHAAITEGWFLLPRGRNLAYSKTQFFTVLGLSKQTPWAHDLKEYAQEASGRLKASMSDDQYSGLWSHPQGLSSFPVIAYTAYGRCVRLPHEWASGSIDVALVQQCLIDSFNASCQAKAYITGLLESGALLPSATLSSQIDAMKSLGRAYEIDRLLMSTRRLYLDQRAKRALIDSLPYPNAGQRFQDYLTARADQEQEQARSGWRNVFSRIHHVAGVMLEFNPTEHLGTVNRRLREKGGTDYRMEWASNSSGHKHLLMALGGNYYAGRHVTLATQWAYRNWIIALSDALQDCEPTYTAYVAAEQNALARIDLDGTSAGVDAKPWRPHDDFEDDVAPIDQSKGLAA